MASAIHRGPNHAAPARSTIDGDRNRYGAERPWTAEPIAAVSRIRRAADDDANDEEALAATCDNGIELIKDRVNQLDWEDMERLVAGMLKAMGYSPASCPRTPMMVTMSWHRQIPRSWSRPESSLKSTHRKGAMGAPAVRPFIGGLRAGDRGLYVSTGGFTKEARYEADRANVPVRLLDLDAFVRHYVDAYDKADDDTRSILPLTRIWWPA